MNDQRLLALENKLNGVEIEFQQYQQMLNHTWHRSITVLIDNLFEETRILLQKADRQKLQTLSGSTTNTQIIREREAF